MWFKDEYCSLRISLQVWWYRFLIYKIWTIIVSTLWVVDWIKWAVLRKKLRTAARTLQVQYRLRHHHHHRPHAHWGTFFLRGGWRKAFYLPLDLPLPVHQWAGFSFHMFVGPLHSSSDKFPTSYSISVCSLFDLQKIILSFFVQQGY